MLAPTPHDQIFFLGRIGTTYCTHPDMKKCHSACKSGNVFLLLSNYMNRHFYMYNIYVSRLEKDGEKIPTSQVHEITSAWLLNLP